MIATLLAATAAIGGMTWTPDVAVDLPSAMVALHGAERTLTGAPPVEWDEGLAHDAAAWADHLAERDAIEHDRDNRGEGENLWLGTRGAYTLAEMVGAWSGEKGTLAGLGSWEDAHVLVGHYTQMVWGRTSRIGCAVRSSAAHDILVCRYSPAGNVIGEMP